MPADLDLQPIISHLQEITEAFPETLPMFARIVSIIEDHRRVIDEMAAVAEEAIQQRDEALAEVAAVDETLTHILPAVTTPLARRVAARLEESFDDGCIAASESLVYDLAEVFELECGLDSKTAHRAASVITSINAEVDDRSLDDETRYYLQKFVESLADQEER